MKTLIIGANSCLSQKIIKKINNVYPKSEIIGLYHKRKQNLKEEAEYISNLDGFKNQQYFDAIIFVASHIPLDMTSKPSNRLIETNISLLLDVLKRFSFGRIIYASSVSVYPSGTKLITENTKICPKSAYALSKLAGELICSQYDNYYNLRISSLLGDSSNQHSFVNRAIDQAKQLGEIVIFGDGSRMQNYIDVSDCADYFVSCLKANGSGNFLAVADQSYSNIQIANYIADKIPNSKVRFEGRDDSPSFLYDNSMTRNFLNVVEGTSIFKSIDRLVDAE